LIGTQAIKQKCMAPSASPLKIQSMSNDSRRWGCWSHAAAAGQEESLWLGEITGSISIEPVGNRKPGVVSRPGVVLECQFPKYTDLPGGVNNAEVDDCIVPCS
jgi:hypothetical protein